MNNERKQAQTNLEWHNIVKDKSMLSVIRAELSTD